MQLKWREGQWTMNTLFTRIVPASPLRPTTPRRGGKAQSSPTITLYKYNDLFKNFI